MIDRLPPSSPSSMDAAGRRTSASSQAKLKPAQKALMHLGDVYDALTDHPRWYRQNQALLTHLPGLSSGATVMDFGSGTGVGTLAMAEMRPDVQFVGVEFCGKMVGRAEKNREVHPQQSSTKFVQSDAASIARESASVDAVVANSFLYLVPDPVAVLREANRLLRPGGRLVFMEPRAETGPFDLLRAGADGAFDFLGDPQSALRFGAAMGAWKVASTISACPTEAQLRSMFREAGFGSIRFERALSGLGHYVIAER